MRKEIIITEKDKKRCVDLKPHNSSWSVLFQQESRRLKEILGTLCNGVYHIGSTAIPDIYAKPIIDILICVNSLSAVDSLNQKFTTIGYHCMGSYGIEGRRFYWRGTPAVHTHHIHLFEQGHPEVNRHLTFVDYMRLHPCRARAYSIIKQQLALQFKYDVDAYIDGKSSFIQMVDYQAGVARSEQLIAVDAVKLEEYNPRWQKLAVAEINSIKEFIHLPFVAIEHLGSTAVKGLAAKPVIDIFITIPNFKEVESWIKPLENLGYLFWYGNPDKSHYRFIKGMPPCGLARSHHVHILQSVNEFNRRVQFKQILQSDESIRNNYLRLKKLLIKRYPDDREAYTDGKNGFINQTLAER